MLKCRHTSRALFGFIFALLYLFTFTLRWASPFSRFSQVSPFANGQTTNFRLHDEQTVNGLRKTAWASVFLLELAVYLYRCLCLYLCLLQTEFETAHFRLFSANGKRKFVFPWSAKNIVPIYEFFTILHLFLTFNINFPFTFYLYPFI
jgi:hypothetical protein